MIFIVILISLAVIASERKDNELLCRKLNYAGVALFLVFFGCRGYIWHDWTLYAIEFEHIEWGDLLDYDYFIHREPLWFVYELICKTIFDNYYFFAFVTSALSTVLLVNFFRRYSISMLFALATYAAFSGFELSINLMRNSMALFIFLNAIVYIEKRQLGKYLLACAIAMGIHLSSIIFIPLYFILNRKINKWVFLAVVLIGNIILFSNFALVLKIVEAIGFSNEILVAKIEAYSGFGTYAGSRFVLLQRFIICMLVFLYYEKLSEMSASIHIFINALMIYIIGTYFTSEFSVMSNRIGILFSFSFWILCGYLVKCFFYVNNRRLFAGFIGFVLIFNTYITTSESIKQYENWLIGTAEPFEVKMNYFNKNFTEEKQIDSDKK